MGGHQCGQQINVCETVVVAFFLHARRLEQQLEEGFWGRDNLKKHQTRLYRSAH
eukprot:COSAG02_NODE_2085_length_9885_cov_9.743946_9_plen_54_part_00